MRSINSASSRWPAWTTCLALCTLSGAYAAPITAGCPQPRGAETFEAAFAQATIQRHDIKQLTCAAAMSAAVAARAPKDTDSQMLALDAQINLLEALQLKMETQTYQGGDAFEEIKAAWALGTRNGKAISTRLTKTAESVPPVAGMLMAFNLVSVSSSLVPAEKAYEVAASNIAPLTKLLEKNPKLLDGIGEMMLGRLYFQLPEIAGGDLDKAVEHLKRAHEVNKKSIVFMRWYAESLMALDRKTEASEVLTKMLPLRPEPIQYQSFADELRAGIGLAQRAGTQALMDQLSAKRMEIFKEHPDLQTRQPAAVAGHGGDDPLTGKTVD